MLTCALLLAGLTAFAQPDSIKRRFEPDTLQQAPPDFLKKMQAQEPGKRGIDWEEWKAYLPQIVENEKEEVDLFWQLPWRRDTLKLPYLKGLTRAGPRPPYDPKIAWQRAILVPGMGQIYNRSYWKLPLVYGGYGAFFFLIDYNNQQYQRFGFAFQCAVFPELGCSPEPELQGIDSEGLRTIRNQFRRNRDFMIMLTAGWHVLQTVEAYVDAHLKGFDVSEDLSVQAAPTFVPSMGLGSNSYGAPGLRLAVRF